MIFGYNFVAPLKKPSLEVLTLKLPLQRWLIHGFTHIIPSRDAPQSWIKKRISIHWEMDLRCPKAMVMKMTK